MSRATYNALIAQHGTVARILVVQTQGSVPREVGTAMYLWDGGAHGTIGGGQLEWDAMTGARARLSGPQGIWASHHALGPDLGQCCGGTVRLVTEVRSEVDASDDTPVHITTVDADTPSPRAESRAAQMQDGTDTSDTIWLDGTLIERVAPHRPPLWIWGAGHVGHAITNVMQPLEMFHISVIDTTQDRMPDFGPGIDTLIAVDMPALVRFAPRDAHHLIVTYSHDTDLSLCDALLRHGFDSAGLIGSATKWARFRKRLQGLGHADGEINRITCPIGDPKLGKHPQAIAVSVATRLLTDSARQNARGTT